MMKRFYAQLLLCTVAASGLCSPSLAVAGDGLHGAVAVGGAYKPDYEGADHQESTPLLAAELQYKTYYVEVLGAGANINVSPYSAIEFGPTVSYGGGRDDDVDSDAVSRMREIDDALEIGAFVKMPFDAVLMQDDTVSLNAEIATDVSDAHDGTVIKVGVGYGRPFSDRLDLDTSLQATYATENYNQTYFGVDADNATRSGLAQYDADAGLKDVGIKVKAHYRLSKRWGVLGVVGYDKLLGDAADSPIVDQEGDDDQWIAGMGLSYRF